MENGKLITTAGVSAGIDGALHVVAKLKGMKEALLVTGILEYDKWNPQDGLVIGQQNMMQEMEGMHIKHMEIGNQPASSNAEVLNTDIKDPVCGMSLTMGMNSNYNVTYNTKKYHF